MPAKLGPGRQLGKYEIQERIADGGFATVYRALDSVEGIHVALKVPRADLITPGALEWFREEIRLHARLDHPNILLVKNADVIDGQLLIAYPLGVESLADRLRRRLGIETFLSLAEQMLEAVAHTHQSGIIHCDVKPENFILFPDSRIRLTDFSISKLAQRTVMGSGSGTLGYVAPEQAMGKASFRSDVFSLGLILYQMLTGEVPEWPFRWPGPGHATLRRKVPPRFVDFLRRALSVEPERRFRNARDMLTAFRKLRPAVRRHQAQHKRRRRGNTATATRDWKDVRFRQFKRQYGGLLELRHTCRKCGGPTSEAMSGCPWCGATLSFKGAPTRFPARCPRCHRGRKRDWKFCAWCYGGRFAEVSDRSYSDQRYVGHCRHPACRGPLLPFSRYCPWCRRKVAKPPAIRELPHRCRHCGWGVDRSYWDRCPWCRKRLDA